MDISIILPIYNGSQFLNETIEQLDLFFKKSKLRYEILLCDDGSSDESLTLLKQMAHEYDSVSCYSNETNQGLGYTLQRLLKESKGNSIIYLDCDLPFGITILSEILENLKNYDIVVASRYLTRDNNIKLIRRIFSRGYYYFCKCLFGVTVLDIGSGTVGMRKESIQSLEFFSKRFSFHLELYVRAAKAKLSILEIPAVSRKISMGSFSLRKHGWGAFVDTLTLYLKLNKKT